MSDESPNPARCRGPSSGLLGILGFFGGCASVGIAGRWGFSPLLLGVLGLFAAPMVGAVARWYAGVRFGGWLGQLGALVVVVLMCAGFARWTARITPDQAFVLAFGMPVPPGLGPVDVRCQYFDGYVVSLAFRCDATQLNPLLSGRSIARGNGLFDAYRCGERTWSQCWKTYSQPWVQLAAPGWPDPPPPATDFYESQGPDGRGDPHMVRVFWNADSGQAYVLYAGG